MMTESQLITLGIFTCITVIAYVFGQIIIELVKFIKKRNKNKNGM